MNPFNRTLKFAGVAGASALLAAVSWYASQPSDVAGFGDIGQPFFPDFNDVTKATSLAVIDYDADQKEPASFSVKQNDDGLWVIPSHHNYPAEAKDRLAKTATSLMGVKKTAVQSRSKDDWKRFGVVDPDADGAATAEERGTRLTLSDGSGNPLVDLIVGNEVEGRSGNYFVRVPENNTTYVSELDVDLSAKFSDWIEPDLLKINSTDVVKIVLDNYSVNEERGTVEKKELLEFVKEGLQTSGEWELADLKQDTEEFDKSPVSSIATNLDALKIVGVRPKPDGLGSNMRVNPAVKQILQMQMQSQGYFIGGDKDGNERLYSNEGELVAGISNGVEYTLYFGEIARGTGKDIEVGLSDEAKKKEDAKEGDAAEPDDAGEDSEEGPRRYLLVKVDFNESLLGEKPVPPLEPIKPEILTTEATPAEDKAAETKTEAPAAPPEDAKEEAKEEPPAAADDSDACDPQDEPVEPAADEPVVQEQPKPDAPTETPADEKPEPAKPAEDTPAQPPEAKPETAEVKPETAEIKKADETPAAAEPAKETEAATEAKPENMPAKESAPQTDEAPKADEVPKTDEAPGEPAAPQKDPRQLAQEEFDAALAKYKSEKSTYDSELKSYEAKVEEGQKKAKELATRFGSWYYVISSDSFEKFRIERKDVVSAKAKEDEKQDSSPEGAEQ